MLNGLSEKGQHGHVKRLHSGQQAAFLGTLGESPHPEQDCGDFCFGERREQR